MIASSIGAHLGLERLTGIAMMGILADFKGFG
jgi:hypothetical protein